MSALVQKTFLAEKNLCKKSADLHPRQGNLLQRNSFTGLTKTSLYVQHKIGWRPAEKSCPFQHASSSTKISMRKTGSSIQRDQMSFCPKCSKPIFCQNKCITLIADKGRQKCGHLLRFSKNYPKYANNHPMS
jgi:hypothetical protein